MGSFVFTEQMIKPLSVQQLLAEASKGPPFAFVRYGDGEWNSILGMGRGANCDGHQYFAEMRIELGNVLKAKPPYLLGMQNLAVRLAGPSIGGFMEENGLLDLSWYKADVLHHANEAKGELQPFIEYLRTLPLVVVGPPTIRRAAEALACGFHIEVPRQAYMFTDVLVQRTETAIQTLSAMNKKPVIVTVSASMPAEILIDRIYRGPMGPQCLLFDVGSIFDPYCGIASRSYMRKSGREYSLSELRR